MTPTGNPNNRKWILAPAVLGILACIGLVVLVIVAVVCAPLAIGVFSASRALSTAAPLLGTASSLATEVGTGGIAGTEVYQLAIAQAQADPAVIAALGEPIAADDANASGEVTTRGISGTADIIVLLSGPKNSGTLQASARKENGVWNFYTLAVEVNGEIIEVGK